MWCSRSPPLLGHPQQDGALSPRGPARLPGSVFWCKKCGSCEAVFICHPQIPTSAAAQNSQSLLALQLLASGRCFSVELLPAIYSRDSFVGAGVFFLPQIKEKKPSGNPLYFSVCATLAAHPELRGAVAWLCPSCMVQE